MTPRWPFVALLVGIAALGARGAPEGAPPATARAFPASDAVAAARPESLPSQGGSPETDTATTWYCAAGTAGGLADHRVIVANPGEEDVNGAVKLFSQEGSSRVGRDVPPGDARVAHPISVPARSEIEVVLSELDDPAVEPVSGDDRSAADQGEDDEDDERKGDGGEGDEGDEDGGEEENDGGPTMAEAFVAALVEADGDVSVDHQVEGPTGDAQGPCTARGASEWHFAWGTTTRDASDFLVLFNPFPNDVVVDATFVTEGGVREPVSWQGLVVPAGRVIVADVGDDVTRRDRVAATIQARNGGLIVERLHVFDGSRGVEGLWLAAGHPVPQSAATFAGEALDEDSNELIALYNPGEETAEVDVEVWPGDDDASLDEPPRPIRLVVRPRQVRVLDFAEESRIEAGERHVTIVESTNDVPVVAQQILLRGPETANARG